MTACGPRRHPDGWLCRRISVRPAHGLRCGRTLRACGHFDPSQDGNKDAVPAWKKGQ